MRFLLIIKNVAFTLLLFCNNIYAETIFFAPLPYVVKETTIGSNLPLVDYLKKTTNLPIELTYISNYDELLEQFKRGKVQIITLGPLPYFKLKNEFPYAQAIVFFKEKDGSTSYSCLLITSYDGPNSLKDMKGNIALTQKHSTCGMFSASILLSKEGLDIKKMTIKHFNTHNEVAEAVIKGNFVLGFLRKDIADQYKGFAIKILRESSKWPSISVVVNTKTLSSDVIKKLEDALLTLEPSKVNNLVFGRYGFARVSEKDFQIIRKYERFFE